MIRVRVFADLDVLDAIDDNLTRVPALAKGQFNRRLRSIKQRLEAAIIASEPGAPHYPYIWSLNPRSNERARRYYFGVILKGKRGRGRYQRTGKLLKAFNVKISLTDEGGLMTIENDADGVDYVMGDRQIYGHQRTGWQHIDSITQQYSDIATDELIDDWFTISDPFAGIPQT